MHDLKLLSYGSAHVYIVNKKGNQLIILFYIFIEIRRLSKILITCVTFEHTRFIKKMENVYKVENGIKSYLFKEWFIKFERGNIGLIDNGNTHTIVLGALVFITKRGNSFCLPRPFLSATSSFVRISKIKSFIFLRSFDYLFLLSWVMSYVLHMLKTCIC